MNNQEFKEKFLGNKVNDPFWGSGVYVLVEWVGQLSFSGVGEDGCDYSTEINDANWELYEEHKPKVKDPRTGMTKFIIHQKASDGISETAFEGWFNSLEDARHSYKPGYGYTIYTEEDFK